MLGFLKSDPYTDSDLGTFLRSGGKWRGKVTLPGLGERPVALSGNRKQPDRESVHLARQFPSQYESLLPDIQQALFEHYEPYLQAHEDGEFKNGEAFPRLKNDAALWDHVRLLGISIAPDWGGTITEIAYETDWDEEHTVGARIRDGKLIELNGSIGNEF
jgi:hypothetical protein